jgi:hypothetical protein
MKKVCLAALLCLLIFFFTFGEELLAYIDKYAVSPGEKNISIIEDWAFAYNDLIAVNIPEGILVIGKGAFANNALSSVLLPRSLQTIDEWAFAHNNISTVVFPENVTLIGEYAFWGNNILEVTIGNYVHLSSEAIDSDFYNCYNTEKKVAGRYVKKNGTWLKESDLRESAGID